MAFKRFASILHELSPEAREIRRQRAISRRLEDVYGSNEDLSHLEAERLTTPVLSVLIGDLAVREHRTATEHESTEN